MAETQFKKISAEEAQALMEESPGGVRPATELEKTIINDKETASSEWYEDPVMAARMFLDGVTFGFSDEIGAAMAAGMAKVSGAAGDAPYSEVYKDIVQALEDERTAYETDNMGASIGLNLAGAVASAPASLAVKTTQMLGRGAQALSRTMPMFANANKWTRAGGKAAAVGTGVAAEGALTGVGLAEQGEDVADAAIKGAITSVIASSVLGTGGGMARFLSNRRVEKSLGEGENFLPVTIADPEGTVGKFYRNVVGGLFFGNSALKQQEQRWLKPLEDTADKLTAGIKASKKVPSIAQSLSRANKTVDRAFEAAKRRVSKGITQEKADALKAEKDKINTITSGQVAKVEEVVNNAERKFRRRIVESSIPASSRQAERTGVLSDNPDMNTAMGRLRDLWRDRGFEVIKQRSFRVPSNYLDRLKLELGSELDEYAKLNGTAPLRAVDLIENVLTSSLYRGRIDGEDLSALRSRVGANTFSFGEDAAQAQTRFAMRYILDDLNELVRGQLKDADVKKFDGDLKAWKTMVNLSDSVIKASTQPGQRGAFTASDWLSTLRVNQRKALERGNATFQREANRMGDLASNRDNLLVELADAAKKREADFIDIQEGVYNKRINDLALERVKADKATADKLKERMDRLEEIKGEIQQIKPFLTSGSSSMSNLGSLAFIGSGIIGGSAGGPLGATASMGAAYGLARFLSSRKGQQIAAGQTGTQELVNKIVNATFEPARRGGSFGAQQAETSSVAPSEAMKIARTGDTKAQAAMFRKLQAQGRLSELRKSSPDVYAVLAQGFKESR